MKWQNKLWQFATALVVAIIILNPEMIELAFFIDVVGLDMFLLLFEVQVLVIVSAFYNTSIKPIFDQFKCYMHYPKHLILITPTPATIMHLLILSVVTDIAFNQIYAL